MKKLATNLCGINLSNPLILASGIIGTSASLLIRAAKAGLGAVTSKSIGPRKREGYCNPSIIEIQDGTCLNAVGLANPGVDEFVEEIPLVKKEGIPLIASIFGNDDDEYVLVASKVASSGVDAIELNISCPHAKVSSIGADVSLTRRVVSLVKNHVKVPVFVKLNPNVTNIVEIGLAAQEGGADAVVAINTIRGMVIDIETMKPILSNKIGGVSGKAIKPMAIKTVYELHENLEIPIIGCGGIFSSDDVIEFMLAGASAVQIGTAFINGLSIIGEIKRGLMDYCLRKGFDKIGDIVGKSHDV
ncbi:MAG: dihydroorotate dehydrogenase [Promethearchaeota archaeon]